MKLWAKVLIVGIVILIIGFMVPMDKTFGFSGMYVVGLGLLLIIGAIVAVARRLMGQMVNE